MEQEMEMQVLDVSNLSERSSKPSCELCFLVKASPMSCGHIICHKCLEEFMLTNNVVGTTCPICEAMKSYVEVTRTGRRSTSDAITDQPGPSEPTENCKLCTKPVYAKPTSHKALRDCGHYTCYDCLQQFPDQITGSTFPCPFCRHCGILNGKSSGRQKRKTRAKMDETKIQGSGVDEPFVFPKLEDLKL
ncbi:unnamed protein product [Caenorhabditis brenneri]